MRAVKALMVLGCMFILGYAPAQERFVLEYKYEKGKTYRYQEDTKFESVQEVSGQEMKATGSSLSVMKMVVEDVTSEGHINMVTSLEDMSMTTKMSMIDTTMVLKELLGKRVRLILSSRGSMIEQSIIDTTDAGKTFMGRGNSLMTVYKEFVIFPDSALKMGDTWNDDRTDTTQGTEMYTRTAKTYTLAGKEDKNGHSCLTINFSGKVEIEGKMNQMGMEFFIEGEGETSGKLWFDPSSGIIIAKESTSDQDITMAMTGQMQMTIPMTTTTTSGFFLVE